jgi:hypothetical protein
VPVADTVRSFKEIVEGEHDDIPERAFYMKGTIDEVLEEVKGSGKKKDQPKAEEEDSEEKGTSDEDEDTSNEQRATSNEDEDEE